MELTNTEVPETEGLTGPADETPKVTARVARKPKACKLCGAVGKNTRTHGIKADHPETRGAASGDSGV